MQIGFALLMTAVLATGGLAHAFVPAPAVPSEARGACGAPQAEALPEAAGEVLPLNATITQIDYTSGRLNLDTEFGPFEAVAAPAEIRDLKVGDEIVVYVIDGETGGADSFRMPVFL